VTDNEEALHKGCRGQAPASDYHHGLEKGYFAPDTRLMKKAYTKAVAVRRQPLATITAIKKAISRATVN
jgi:hypothetical protein